MDEKKREHLPGVRIFDSKNELIEAVASIFRQEADRAAQSDNNMFVALSGGETPRGVYYRLGDEPYRSEIPWRRVHLFWGDERCVPADHPDSNYRMVSENLLSRIDIPPENIHRIRGEADPEEETVRYVNEIALFVPRGAGDIPRFDWILSGLGRDGHVASLFADSPALMEEKFTCAVTSEPHTGANRITMTLPLINNASRISFMVSGREKSGIVSEILKSKRVKSRYPAATVKPRNGILEWLIDSDAASEL